MHVTRKYYMRDLQNWNLKLETESDVQISVLDFSFQILIQFQSSQKLVSATEVAAENS